MKKETLVGQLDQFLERVATRQDALLQALEDVLFADLQRKRPRQCSLMHCDGFAMFGLFAEFAKFVGALNYLRPDDMKGSVDFLREFKQAAEWYMKPRSRQELDLDNPMVRCGHLRSSVFAFVDGVVCLCAEVRWQAVLLRSKAYHAPSKDDVMAYEALARADVVAERLAKIAFEFRDAARVQ